MHDLHKILTSAALLGALALGGCDDAENEAVATGGTDSGGTVNTGGSPANTGGSGGAATGASDPGGGSATGGGSNEECLGPEYGWEMGAECLAAHQALCAEQTEATCESTPYCKWRAGEQLDESLQCREQFGEFCVSFATGCGASLWLGRDLDGRTWYFTDTCIPYGWESAGSANPTGEGWTYTPCDEPGGAGGGGAGGGGSSAD